MSDRSSASTGSSASTASTASTGGTAARVVRVSVNGKPREIAPSTTLDELVATMTVAASGVAAALNETVVPRGSWSRTRLGDGDRVEVLTAVQGG